MGSEWQVVSLADAPVQIIDGDRGENYPKQSDFLDRGYCLFLNAGNVTSHGFSFSQCQYITSEKDQILRKGKLERNDVVLTTRGTVGNVAFYGDCIPFEHIRINSGMVIFRANINRLYPPFLYQVLRSKVFTTQVAVLRTGSAQPQLPIRDINRIRIPLPPLPEQRAIARILGALDDKIELNRQMNATLEAIARALFKSWFVDFDPVRAKAEGERGKDEGGRMKDEIAALFPDELVDSELGEIPKGWGIKPLDQIANFLNGLALQNYPPEGNDFLPVIKIAQMRKGNTEGADKASSSIEPAYIVDNGDVLFSWSGSLEVILWCGGKGALNQHLFEVTSANYPKWFFYHWVKHHLPEFQQIAAGKATTMGHIQRHHLSSVLALVPPVETLQAMDNVMSPLLDRIITGNIQSRTLAALRDTLLPKLISGELRVPEKFTQDLQDSPD